MSHSLSVTRGRSTAPASAPAHRGVFSALGLSLVLLGSLSLSRPAGAENIDKVVAVVNDEVILLSEVQEQMALFQAAQQVAIRDSAQAAQLQKQILDQLIEEKLIVDYATKEGVTIPDDQLNTRVEEMIGDIKQRLGSEEAFQAELKSQGLTLETLRERYRQDLRKQMMAQRIVDREIRSKVKVTETDVDTFFKNNQKDLPPKPVQYHLAHILVMPKADQTRRAAARLKANDVLQRLESGADWASMVQKYSEDTSTKSTGGDLGVVNEGDFDERFEAAIRDLQPGQRTGVVETRFGFHIIEVVARSGTTYRPRHILIAAQPTPSDDKAAIERAEKVRADAAKGQQSWDLLVNSYSDDLGTKDKAGDLGLIPVSALSREDAETLDSLKIGGISPVMRGPTGYHVFKMIGKEQGGAYSLDEIREQLENMLTQKKLAEEYDRWMAGIRKKSFIEIKGL